MAALSNRILPLLLLLAPAGVAGEQAKELKILAIGNSFSGNASRYLPDIAKSSGSRLTFGHAMIGGCPLEKHLALARRHEEAPDDPAGKPYRLAGAPASLKQLLQADNWQIVTIQQYSVYSMRAETFRPYAKELCAYIGGYAPQAEIAIHQTWAYRMDDTNTFKDGYTHGRMHRDLAKNYSDIARELDIRRVIPVGDAFELAYEDPAWQFSRDPGFNYAAPTYPKLPKELHSLHGGCSWMREKDGTFKFIFDTHHANSSGEYLAGCVWFETLFGGDATKITFKPAGMSEEDAAFLRSIAHARVTGGKLPRTLESQAGAGSL